VIVLSFRRVEHVCHTKARQIGRRASDTPSREITGVTREIHHDDISCLFAEKGY